MNPDETFSPNGGGDIFDESEVARVLDAFLADREAGREADQSRLLAEHPAIAEQLRACLEVMDLAGEIVRDSGASGDELVMTTDGSQAAAAQGDSPATTLKLEIHSVPNVQLREVYEGLEPPVKSRSAEMPAPGAVGTCRFQLQGEIARGGMGAILKGRDVDLGRDLAIKVLLDSHQGDSQLIQRFIEEAQIGGQLQHPGIVPVYELGTFADCRPFFAMKLVKGQTLAELLQKRRAVGDLPRFLSIFEAVCQTIAYSHARGVIHRDLKPANVMVGSFGEVQVMDWGLAKVLSQGGVAGESTPPEAAETVVLTVRSGSDGDASHAGSVLGTPSYMAPEQARGELDRVDERADVFGLGAILCELLTGKPPFVGRNRDEIRGLAARGDLAETMQRLGSIDADSELIALARDCLAADRQQRRATPAWSRLESRPTCREFRIDCEGPSWHAWKPRPVRKRSENGVGSPSLWRLRCCSPPACSEPAGPTWPVSTKGAPPRSILLSVKPKSCVTMPSEPEMT